MILKNKVNSRKNGLSKKIIAIALLLSIATSQANASFLGSLFSIFGTKKSVASTRKTGFSLTSKAILSIVGISAIALITYFWSKNEGPKPAQPAPTNNNDNPPAPKKPEVRATEPSQPEVKPTEQKKEPEQPKQPAQPEVRPIEEPKKFTASPLYKWKKGAFLMITPYGFDNHPLEQALKDECDSDYKDKDPYNMKYLIEQGAYIYINWPHRTMAGRDIENCFTNSIDGGHLEKALCLAANGIKLTGNNKIPFQDGIELHAAEKALFIYQQYDITDQMFFATNNPQGFDENLLQDVVFSRSVLEVTQEDKAPQKTAFYAMYFAKKLSLQDLKNIKARSLVCRPDMKEGMEKLEMAILSEKFYSDNMKGYEKDALSEERTANQTQLINESKEASSGPARKALGNSFMVLHDLSFSKNTGRILPPEHALEIIHFAGIDSFENKLV